MSVSLDRFAQVTQPRVCFHILCSMFDFFSMTVIEKENIRKSVLTWLKINNSRNAVRLLSFSMAGI